MSQSMKKQPSELSALPVPTTKLAQQPVAASTTPNVDSKSKQSRVIALLLSPKGTTIAAMMKITGWQRHSVRGFLAGVVRKRLKLKLDSKKIDGNRIYRIARGIEGKSGLSRAKHRSH